jgi:dodecin
MAAPDGVAVTASGEWLPASGNAGAVRRVRPMMCAVTVQKAVDLTGAGDTIQDAVGEALDRAALTLEGITSFEVQRISGEVESGRPVYRVELRVWFDLRERMHG